MNLYRPQKRKRAKMGVRDTDSSDVPQYRAFVRRHCCAVPGCENRIIQAAHRRKGVPENERGGVGSKPHDKWCYPNCDEHHREQHTIGEDSFDAKHKIDTLKIAAAHWSAWLSTTDSGKRYRLQHMGGGI